MERRQAIRLLGGGFIAAALPGLTACTANVPEAAMAAWRPPAESLEPRRWMVAHAILAPSAHNLQSWLVDLREPDTIVLRMDPARVLPATDPYSRQMVMSQGTFLELLDQAARARGYRPTVEPFPGGPFDPERVDAHPIARVRLVKDATVDRDPLFAHVFERRTNRERYEARFPDAHGVAAILDAVRGAPVVVGVTAEHEAATLAAERRIAKAAWTTELTTPQALLESYRWLRIGPAEIAEHRDGIALNEPKVRLLTALKMFDRGKASAPDSSAIRGQIDAFDAKIDSTPTFFWMRTADNERTTQLAAGRAYVRAQLAATANGLSMHPLQQALQEYPEQVEARAEIHRLLDATDPGATVQMWARLGYGPSIKPAPRRGVEHTIAAA
jgi:hypothetical protein